MYVPDKGEVVIVLTNDGEKRGVCKGQADTWHGENYLVNLGTETKPFHYEDIKEVDN